MKDIYIEHYKSGHYEKTKGYKFFVPELINKQWRWNEPSLNTLLEKASIRLGELNSYARLVPNIDLFIQLHVTKEAVISSRIEGTQTNIKEALLPEEEIGIDRRSDWNEVNNYTIALNSAIEKMQTLPLSSRLLRNTHGILLRGVRGETKLPGEYRTSQNWIGGNSITDALFIPPADAYIQGLMSDLENFLHNRDIHVPTLIKIGIAHYQFETIHPFLDGNGRIGRLLITLYLVSEGLLEKPLLYLSEFFEKNKSLYYDNLTRVREKDDMNHWLKYFLIGIEETSKRAVEVLTGVLKLKERHEIMIKNNWGRRAPNALILLEYLFRNPVINVKKIEEVCNISKKSANELVTIFESSGILIEISGNTRNRLFVFDEYLELFR